MSFYIGAALGIMHAMETYTVIIIMWATITPVLLQDLQNCSDYCKLLSNRYNNTRSDCDCSNYQHNFRLPKQGLLNPEQIEDNDIFHEPVNNNTHQSSPQIEKITLNSFSNSKSTDNEPTPLNTKHRIITTHDTNTKQKKNAQNTEQKLHEIITKDKISLYLDIDLYESVNNKTFHEVLGDMFENFQFIEEHLSQCLNLHIFIFSKNADNINKTNTNWGRNVKQYDKLLNSEVLTEIQNKCNQTNNLVEQSVNDIKRWSLANTNSRLPKKTDRTSYGLLEPSNRNDASISRAKATSMPTLYNGTPGEDNPWTTAPTLKNQYDTNNRINGDMKIEDTIKSKYYENDKPEIEFNITNTKYSNTTAHLIEGLNNTSEEPKLLDNLPIQANINRLQTERTIQTNTLIEKNTNINYLNKYPRYDVISSTPHTLPDNNYFKNTILDVTTRAEYQEGEYLIPKVITKELPNNKVQSVVEGFEIIPNLDFINQSNTSIISTTEQSESVTESYVEQNNDFGNLKNKTILQASGFEIKGRLYFLYGKHQIPARFIQEQDGKLQLAIDGFSLCDQFLQQKKNKPVFMTFLCNCIVLQNCTKTERPL